MSLILRFLLVEVLFSVGSISSRHVTAFSLIPTPLFFFFLVYVTIILLYFLILPVTKLGGVDCVEGGGCFLHGVLGNLVSAEM